MINVILLSVIILSVMVLFHPLDGDTNLKYKMLRFLTPNKKISKKKALAFNQDRCCHLSLCLWLILLLSAKCNYANCKSNAIMLTVFPMFTEFHM